MTRTNFNWGKETYDPDHDFKTSVPKSKDIYGCLAIIGAILMGIVSIIYIGCFGGA